MHDRYFQVFEKRNNRVFVYIYFVFFLFSFLILSYNFELDSFDKKSSEGSNKFLSVLFIKKKINAALNLMEYKTTFFILYTKIPKEVEGMFMDPFESLRKFIKEFFQVGTVTSGLS